MKMQRDEKGRFTFRIPDVEKIVSDLQKVAELSGRSWPPVSEILEADSLKQPLPSGAAMEFSYEETFVTRKEA